MGKIKQAVKKAGFPAEYVQTVMEDGNLVVRFPVMGSREGWRWMEFHPFAGHKKIARRVIEMMELDEYSSNSEE